MNDYQFYQDIKVSMWVRQGFSIEAETEEEAKKIAMQFVNEDVGGSEYVTDTEHLYDTEEFIPLSENHSEGTIQLFLNGEKTPFATNGTKDANQFKSIKDLIAEWTQGVASPFMRTEDGITYYMFLNNNNCLCIIADMGGYTATRYVFNESWIIIVQHNRLFRKLMMEYLLSKNMSEETVFAIHDWLHGYCVDVHNVPFTLKDFIAVWGNKACTQETRDCVLLGWQINNDEGEMPEGFLTYQVIKDKEMAEHELARAQEAEPDKGYTLYPVYEGDIEEPTFI